MFAEQLMVLYRAPVWLSTRLPSWEAGHHYTLSIHLDTRKTWGVLVLFPILSVFNSDSVYICSLADAHEVNAR